jgi:hypothetical protein
MQGLMGLLSRALMELVLRSIPMIFSGIGYHLACCFSPQNLFLNGFRTLRDAARLQGMKRGACWSFWANLFAKIKVAIRSQRYSDSVFEEELIC